MNQAGALNLPHLNMTERPLSEIEVTPENLPALRQEIASLREEKGREEETLRLINRVRPEAIKLEEHEHVVNLYWEEHLVGQHMIMMEKSKADEIDFERIAEGLKIMEEATIKGQEYIDANSVESLRPRSHRFLGRVADYKGEFNESRQHYEKAVELFEKEEDLMSRVNRLEIQGFLAYSLIMTGEIQEGLELGRRTFTEFDVSPDGKKLKEKDYYTWAVWKSGVAIRIINELVSRDGEYDREELTNWLDEAELILIIPEGDETWGDKNFQFRKDEIEAVRKKLTP